ncbi:MAG: DUF6273 domain-containing protein [Synergistaceae bacterium]|nr:DUF6273 domain-containing protein [Synergistaceae bacterium]
MRKQTLLVLTGVIVLVFLVDAFFFGSNTLKSPYSSVKTGDAIQFGRFSYSDGNTLELDWRVLDVHNGNALILSDRILLSNAYHYDAAKQEKISMREYQSGAVTWEKSSIRQYLNGSFYDDVFTAEEKAWIAGSRIANAANPWYGTPGGIDTVDKVFLLSVEEVVKYFGDSGQLRNENRGNMHWINDQYNSSRIAKFADDNASWWWLRSPGLDVNRAVYVLDTGYIDLSGGFFYRDEGGVRPALWLKL